MQKNLQQQSGFTLIEAIMVMTITAVLAAGVAVFLRKPIDGYMDLARRTELSDITDTAVRRISRDLHLALPNSVRLPLAGNSCLEFLPTTNGGRYRADAGSPLAGNVFTTSAALSSFDVFGPLSAAPAAGDLIVVYNLGIAGANAYSRDNMATVGAGTTAALITLNPAMQFPFASPGNRFHVLSGTEQAVFYACTGVGVDAAGNGTGTLFRLSAYGINAAEPAVCPTIATIPANTPILAQNVSACQFTYASGVTERSGLVSMRLGVTKSNEEVNIYHEVHVSNVP
ncbi:MAG: prepilin-type N-terminal cleavage/methylation domain-containing protein [Undibacterium sp.]|uniref:PulJ/GspJ family protein n=1 Tax=Undibacterium sp. TaxID=1914977 RepID=UPI002727230C|nr:prepilin-type N-terminal cleavage/methylation domain-containing protein [Undibacterium sp.]MDO8651996.1 prepilin-type N-terminal cleavage/methylation domain-containing protein [Undibacterium sp.]